MAQDKRTFLGGMNKDVDTRLIKNPDYIDALNIRVASSVDGTIGSVENIQGNEKVPTPFYNADQNILFEDKKSNFLNIFLTKFLGPHDIYYLFQKFYHFLYTIL